MKIKFGTNRIVFVTKNFVYKFPILFRGLCANKQEYSNYLTQADIVSCTEYKICGILKQERLYNLKTFPRNCTKKDIPAEFKHLWKYKLNNRFQVGQDKNGKWKFFDYEDVKFYKKLKHPIK